MGRLSVCKSFEFDYAHFLPGYKGKCGDLHGHRGVVELEFEGEIQKGIIVDFSEIKLNIIEPLKKKLDHTLLNGIMDNPTAENTVMFIKSFVEAMIQGAVIKLTRVRFYETGNSYAEWKDS